MNRFASLYAKIKNKSLNRLDMWGLAFYLSKESVVYENWK